MNRRVSRLAAFVLVVLALGACNRDEVTGVAMSASSSAAANALRNVILFAAGQPGQTSQLAIMNPDGSGRQLLTNDPDRTYFFASVSPDGRRIAASRFVRESGFFFSSEGLFVMNADGSGQTLLIRHNDIADAEPAWSPDGSQIAFQTFDFLEFGPASRIYIINVDGTGLRKLSPPTDNDFVFDDSPTWSPDGTKLAFTRDWVLYTINADGTGFSAVPNVDLAFGPSWSPDGTRLAYANASGGIDIRNVDGSNPVTLTSSGSNPSWSPDGRRLVFLRGLSGLSQMFTINADGTGETRLSFATNDSWPKWSPFPGSRSDAGASIAIAPTGTKLSLSESRQFSATVRTTDGSVIGGAPVHWSSANPSIATVSASGMVTAVDYGIAVIQAEFGGSSARAEVRVVDRVLRNAIVYSTDEFGNPTLAAVRPDGTGRRRLTLDDTPYTSPDVSPDGRRIVCITSGIGLFIMDADAQAVSEGTINIFNSFNGHLASPTWSPDGTQLAFRSDVESPSGLVDRIFVINADGSGLRQLTPDDPSSDDDPTWSPDGTRLMFTRNGVLHVINADGTGLTPLPNDDQSSSPDWSPDGSRVAYASPTPGFGIRIRNADGSNPVTVTTQSGDSHPRWAPDNQRLVFVRVVDGRSQLFVVNANGTGEASLSTGAGQHTGPSWSPVP